MFFLSLSVSHDFMTPTMFPTNPKIWSKMKFFTKIIKNQQKLIFFSNSCDRSLEYLLKYLGYDFWGHTTFFWQKYEILNKNNFWKKKQKALYFSKKRYTLNNLGFCIKSALKKIIVTVFEKKKEGAFCFFFSKIFFVQNLIFLSKKVVWPQKSYPRYFRRYSKDLSQEFEKKSIFVDFWWFWWKTSFLTKFLDLWGTLLGS